MATSQRLTIGDAAPASVVLNPAGQTLRLSDFWQTGPVLLSLLRHFG